MIHPQIQIRTKLGGLYPDCPCFSKIVGSVFFFWWSPLVKTMERFSASHGPRESTACGAPSKSRHRLHPPSKPCCQRYQPVPAKGLITDCTERERRILPIPLPNIRILNPNRSRSLSNYNAWICSSRCIVRFPNFLFGARVQFKKLCNISMESSISPCK